MSQKIVPMSLVYDTHFLLKRTNMLEKCRKGSSIFLTYLFFLQIRRYAFKNNFLFVLDFLPV